MNARLFTMPSSSILFLFSAAFSATSALPWKGPQATATYDAADWSPRPTLASVSERELFPRALFFSANTCGFVGGDYYSSITCGSASSCVWDTARAFLGCCPNNGICTTGVYTGCVDTQSGQQTVVDPAVTTCSGPSICYLNSFPRGYHQYGCGAANMAATVETTFYGESSGWNLNIHLTSLDIPAASTIQGAMQTAVPITTGASTSTSPATPVSSHSAKTPVGPIIGGLVAGIAALILAVFLGRYLLRKRKEYYNRRPGRKSNRSERDSSKNSATEKAQSPNTAFHRISNSVSSPIPPLTPEMGIIKTPTFPPPPESHKNFPAPRYFTDDRSPARSSESPIGHIPPRWSPKRLSPVPYVPYIPRPKSNLQISPPVTSPLAYEPLRFSPKPLSPMAFTPIQEKQREGHMMPVSPGFQNTEMSPVKFIPNDGEYDIAAMEPRRMSPVAYLPRRGAQSPTDARNMAREFTRSPSQQSFMQETGAARELITPSPSGSQQPLIRPQNTNNRDLITPSPTAQLYLDPVELPCPTPVRDTAPEKRTSRHKKNSSSTSSRTVRYSIMPPIQSTPPRETRRKPVSKPTDTLSPNTNSYTHIALQLNGSPSQSLKPKTSLQSLKPKSSSQNLTPKPSLQNIAPPRPPRTDVPITNLSPFHTSNPFNTNITTRSVSPEEKEELAQKFRIKASSPKNISSAEFEQAIAQKGGRKGSSDKIERILGLVSLGGKVPGVKRGSKEKNVEVRMGKNVRSAHVEEGPRAGAGSPTSHYEEDDIFEEEEVREEEEGQRETGSICSANILDLGGQELGMGTLPFSMEREMFDQLMKEEGVRRGEKGVKWRDEVASDGELAELRSRLGTPLTQGSSERGSEWGRMEPLRGGGQGWGGSGSGEGGWL